MSEPPVSPSRQPRSAVVITIEGLGARWLGAWGNSQVATPVLDQFAGSAWLVENALAIHGDPVRQIRNWLSPPEPTGTGDRAARSWLQDLKHAGLAAVAYTDSSDFARLAESCFDEVVEVPTGESHQPAPDIQSTSLSAFMAGAAELWKVLPRHGTLLWIHTRGLRLAWDAPRELRMAFKGEEDPEPPESVTPPELMLDPEAADDRDQIAGWQQSLAAQIAVLDHALSILLDAIDLDTSSEDPDTDLYGEGLCDQDGFDEADDDAGRDQVDPVDGNEPESDSADGSDSLAANQQEREHAPDHAFPGPAADAPLVLLSAPDAWGIGEHWRIGPVLADNCYDEYLHVPLLIRFPESTESPVRIPELVAADRITAILAGWLQSTPPVNLLDSSPVPVRQRQVLWSRRESGGFIRTHGWKLVCRGDQRELYVKPDDRWEQNDVANRCPEVVAELSALLERLPASGCGLMPDDCPDLSELLALGPR